jgi:hypothetical protein
MFNAQSEREEGGWAGRQAGEATRGRIESILKLVSAACLVVMAVVSSSSLASLCSCSSCKFAFPVVAAVPCC